MRASFSRSLKRNLELLNGLLYLDRNDDVVTRQFSAIGQDCALLYVEGIGCHFDLTSMRSALPDTYLASYQVVLNCREA